MGIPLDDGEHSFYAPANFYSENFLVKVKTCTNSILLFWEFFGKHWKLAQKDGEHELAYLNSAAKGMRVFLWKEI